MEKWIAWALEQERLGNHLSIAGGNIYAVCVKIVQHEGPDTYMTLPAAAADVILVMV